MYICVLTMNGKELWNGVIRLFGHRGQLTHTNRHIYRSITSMSYYSLFIHFQIELCFTRNKFVLLITTYSLCCDEETLFLVT